MNYKIGSDDFGNQCLGNTITAIDSNTLPTKVGQENFDLASVVAVNRPRRVRHEHTF